MIKVKPIIKTEIIEFEMNGPCEVSDIEAIVVSEYKNASRGVLWNMIEGSSLNISQEDMPFLANVVKEYAKHKKTAYVSQDARSLELLRQYESYARIKDVEPNLKVFSDYDEALVWLML